MIWTTKLTLLVAISMVTLVTGGLGFLPIDTCPDVEIGGDTQSTFCIVGRLCYNHNESRSQGFFDCYESVGIGAELFLGCQQQCLGSYLDTPEHIQNMCRHLSQLGCYTPCLYVAFAQAGLNLTEAAVKINRCQGEVLGLNVPPLDED